MARNKPTIWIYEVELKRQGNEMPSFVTVEAAYAQVNARGDLVLTDGRYVASVVAAFHADSWESLLRGTIKENQNE